MKQIFVIAFAASLTIGCSNGIRETVENQAIQSKTATADISNLAQVT